MRLYGYTYYSDYIWAPAFRPSSWQPYTWDSIRATTSRARHTRGLSATFADQLPSPKHLVELQGSYTTSNALRDNNSGFGAAGNVGWLVSSAAPTSGVCYDANGQPVVGCGAGSQTFTLKQGYNGTVTPANTINGGVCGAGSCQYILGENGQCGDVQQGHAAFHVVLHHRSVEADRPAEPQPRVCATTASSSPARDTTGSAARALWYNAYNLLHPDRASRQPRRRADRVVRRAAAALRFDLYDRPANGSARELRPVRRGAQQRVRAVQLPAAERPGEARAVRQVRSADDAGPPGAARKSRTTTTSPTSISSKATRR